MEGYSSADTIESLTVEQLELIARTEFDILLRVIENTTILDVQRIRLMLELGQVETKRRLDALPSNALAQADAACGVSPGAMGSASG